jgi:hypothetical protein
MVDDRTAVAREAAVWRAMSREERLRHLAIACRGAARQLAYRADRRRLLDHRDALPESTLVALARLRDAHRRGSA